MRNVGEALKEARESQVLTIEDVEKGTKIRKEILLALERNDYSHLPPSTFVQGFIKNYAKFLNLNPETMLAIYRREFSDKRYKPYVMNTFSHPLANPKFQITPTRVLGVLIVTIILAFFAYLWFQYRQFAGTPSLMISSPVDQMSSNQSNVEVVGKTDPDDKVMINDQQIPTEADGSFKESITLTSQVNKLSIVSVSRFGQKTEIDRIVYLRK